MSEPQPHKGSFVPPLDVQEWRHWRVIGALETPSGLRVFIEDRKGEQHLVMLTEIAAKGGSHA